MAHFRNMIVNGDHSSNQRAHFHPFGLDVTSATGYAYTSDQQAIQCQGSTNAKFLDEILPNDHPLLPFGYSRKITCKKTGSASADALCAISTVLESGVIANYAGQTCVLSFRARTNVPGTYAIALSNNFQTRSYVDVFKIASANTWISVRVKVPVENIAWRLPPAGVQLTAQVFITLMAGSSFRTGALRTWMSGLRVSTAGTVNLASAVGNYFQYTDLQLEAGATPTPYERLDYPVNLWRCKRYVQKSFFAADAPCDGQGLDTGEFHFPATRGAGFAQVIPVRFEPEMCFTSTGGVAVTLFNPQNGDPQYPNNQVFDLTAGTDCTASAVSKVSHTGFLITTTAPAGAVAGDTLAFHFFAATGRV